MAIMATKIYVSSYTIVLLDTALIAIASSNLLILNYIISPKAQKKRRAR